MKRPDFTLTALAPQLFRDLVVRSFCVSRFTVNKKAQNCRNRCTALAGRYLHTLPMPSSSREREGAYMERVEKEISAWMEGPRRGDPFSQPPWAVDLPPQPKPKPTSSSVLSGGSRASRRSSASGVSKAAAAADDDDGVRSVLSAVGGQDGLSTLSWRTPSSIRSSEPSAIARNKIAELQLRVELERVTRLQREMELEQQRKDGLIKDAGSALGGLRK